MTATSQEICDKTAECKWESHSTNPPVNEPTEYRCKAADTTNPGFVVVDEYCMTVTTKDSCYESGPNGEKCAWKAVQPVYQGPYPLFYRAFCHPIEVTGTKMTKD